MFRAGLRRSKLALLLVSLTLGATSAVGMAQAEVCKRDQFENTDYVVCSIDPASSDLRLFWRKDTGAPFRSFATLARSLEAEGKKLSFAFNAGMYDTDFTPVGLYIENGKQLRPVNSTIMERPAREIPNFFKQPNGIFFFGPTKAGVLTTEEYIKRKPDPLFATQSGPMLVIRGKLHPALIPGSTDRNRRSGVGVCEDGHVHFAISETRVNFHDFARLFRDHLNCPDALFLDGGRGTGIYSPALERSDVSWHGGYGPMIGLVE
ncbi:phosphodiester glycosidase family protein [Tianweitania aestuarii]